MYRRAEVDCLEPGAAPDSEHTKCFHTELCHHPLTHDSLQPHLTRTPRYSLRSSPLLKGISPYKVFKQKATITKIYKNYATLLRRLAKKQNAAFTEG